MVSLAASLLSPPVEAGSYTVAYSGGSIAAIGCTPNQFTTGSGYCANATIPYNGRGWGGNSINVPDPNSSNSPINAVFTWTHGTGETDANDPPPSCAIVQQSVTVMWTSTEPGGSGLADTGLPGVPVSITSGVQSQGINFSTGAGGASFSVQGNPMVSFSGSSGYVSVQYSANAFAVTIIPNGAKQDSTTGAYSLLTGQQVSTGLTGVPFTPGTGSTYQWSAGGDTFYTYNEKAASHQLVLLSDDPSYTTSPGFSFYDKSKESVTITCKAVLVCPDGTSLTINPSSQQISVVKPSVTKWGIETGNVYYSHANDAYGLYPAFGTGYPGGVYWHDVSVSVPPPFSGGTCCFTQLVKPNHLYNGVAVGPNSSNNGVLGLDNSFEYYNYSWAAGSTGTENDSPSIQVGGGKTIGDIVTANDSLQTWLMYQPAGGVWVPLQKYSYSWAVTLTWVTPGSWSVSGQNPAPPNPGPQATPSDAKDPPQWSVVQTNASKT